jgi:PAS domain S-box-containing protein
MTRPRRTPLDPRSRETADFELLADSVSFPIFLIDLTTYRIVLANDPAAALVGWSKAQLADRAVTEFFDTAEGEGVRHAIEALRSGAIDGYRSHRRILRPDGQGLDSTVWTRVLGSHLMPTAMTVVMPGGDGVLLASSVPPFIAQLAPTVVCILDAEWRVTWVNVDVEEVLGYTASEYLGVPLLGAVHPDDLSTVLDAIDEMRTRRAGRPVCARLRRSDGTWRPMDCMLVPISLDEPARYGLFSGPAAPVEHIGFDQAARVVELESRMLRIATQLRAAGVTELGALPDLSGVEGLDELSPRQADILTRLLRGERVATIAAELYVSPTTVRNHLTAIFRKFGVHSQTELLELLRPQPPRDAL